MIKKTQSQNIPNNSEAYQSLDAQRQAQKIQSSNTMGASLGIAGKDNNANNGLLFDPQNPLLLLQQKSAEEMKLLEKQQQVELKRQMTVFNALSSQMQGSQNAKESRLEYLNRIYENGNLGFQFFEKKQDTEKINVEFEQVNKALNIVRATKKDKDNKKKDSSSSVATKDLPCALLTLQEMKQRMQILNVAFPSDELQLLFPQRKEINARELTELLKPNLIEKDPLAEAIKLFLDANGEVSKVKLNQVLKYLGHGTLDAKELSILKDILDIDGDGKISGEDLRQVLSTSNSIFSSQKRRMSQQSYDSDKKTEGMNTPQA